ncbi:MAG: glycosyltransferase [Deltaproteobacteria bacterium]|nr:glycosyltransferase [Deltaproteobacteria bacterium]
MTYLIAVPYVCILMSLAVYGLHRSHLVFLLRKYRNRMPVSPPALPIDAPVESLPHVTVQLPLFNEPDVVERLLEVVARLEYPREKLEIQVLDDSTDDTRELARAKVEELARRGLDAVYIHRHDRTGFKAGALDYGQRMAKGELIAVFDADFLPQPDFLRTVVPHFDDEKIGCVQARWGHMNREHSLLTRIESLMLDGHHMVENGARYGSGRFFNFSGTGGMWRRTAIEAAGGWQHDTLTEDLDLSYRAQLAGYRFVYRVDHVTPAELPEEMEAFRAQQFRWAKGTVQTARKLLGRVWARKDLSLHVRTEAIFHMTPHFAYPLMMFLSVFLLPMLIVMPASDPRSLLLVDIPLMVGSTGSVVAFYVMANVSQGRSALNALVNLPPLMALGCGMSPYLTKAVFQGMGGPTGEFIRTPKKGDKSASGQRYHARTAIPWVELMLAAQNFIAIFVAIQTQHFLAAPFALMFGMGYLWVGASVLRERLFVAQKAHTARNAAPAVALAPRTSYINALVPNGSAQSDLVHEPSAATAAATAAPNARANDSFAA